MNTNRSIQCRIEGDALGKVEVPGDHLWGAQTRRSHLNFPISVERYCWGRPVVRALGTGLNADPRFGEWVRPQDMTPPLAALNGVEKQ